ncbi:MAG TPA: phosphotransferase [Terracidiphilus sp.]|nr:phosphotransferase [Terracidiphilus sp.]
MTKTHGLDGTLVEPDWAPLTMAEIRSVLEHFPDVAEPIAILSTSPRPFSAASVAETRRGRVFVKRHARAVRDAEGLLEEHCFMRHLLANGISVPRVLASSTEHTALESGNWTYEVHEVPTGIDLYGDAISWTPFQSTEHARSAGEMLARMHLAGASYKAPARKARPLVASFTIFGSADPRAALKKYISERPALAADPLTCQDSEGALELLAPFRDELKPFLSSLEPLWTHNDLHASNLFWNGRSTLAHATSVIDFGLADRTNAVHDLAQAIERNIVEWLALMQNPDAGALMPVHIDHVWAMLEGYESVRPLSSAEASALTPMLALCHAEFALTEADYFLGVLHSPEKARVATRDYLLGHSRWFHETGSQKLLEPMRRWAETRKPEAVRA